MFGKVVLSLLAASVAGVDAQAIIMRHDVDRSGYVLLGDRHRETVAMLGLPAQSDGSPMLYSGMGTLIAPDWVLTAAHATDYIRQQEKDHLPQHMIFVKGRGYRVLRIVTHPQWDPEKNVNDIALIQLATPVREAQPACLFEGTNELNQLVTIAGSGYPGNGKDGPSVPDGALLGATVLVDTANPAEIRWKFRPPEDPRTTPLEGISGPGDSGGPAFISVAGHSCVAGVSSSQAYEVDPNKPDTGEMGQGHYGAIEIYTRVSAFVPWIKATMRKPTRPN